MLLTPEQVDEVAGPPSGPEASYYRHLYFIHFTLGEPWLDSFHMAHAFRYAPLSVENMRSIAAGWKEG